VSRLEAEKSPSASLPEPAVRVPVAGNGRAPTVIPNAAWRGAALTVPQQQTGTDTTALLKALARRWPLALVMGMILAAAGGAAAWFLLAAPYNAFAQVRVDSSSKPILFKNAEEGRNEFLTFLKTQAKHLKSRFVLNEALKREEVKGLSSVLRQPDPLLWLEDELVVESLEGAEFITVSLRGQEAEEMVALVGAVIKAYVKEIVEVETQERKQRLDKLETFFLEKENALSQKKDRLKDMIKEVGTTETLTLTQKQLSLLNMLTEQRKNLAQAKGELLKAQLQLKSYRAQEPKMPEVPSVEAYVNENLEADPDVKLARNRIERHQEDIADYERRAVNKNDPDLKKIRQAVEKLEKKIADRREKLQASAEERVRADAQNRFTAMKSSYEAQLPALQETVDIWTKEEKRLRDEVELLAKEADKIGGEVPVALEMLKTDIARDSELLHEVGKNRDILRLEQGRPPRVSVFQEAALQKHDIKRQVLAAILAAVAGLALACVGVGWLECRVRRIHSVDEVTTGLGLRLVGAVPPTAPAVLRLPATIETKAEEHHFVESIDGIRTMLLRDARAGGLRLVMVTSAVSGEGKTTLAGHLATSLARAGRRTLLVDCDLRRPAAHQLFEAEPHPGLSEVLLGEVPAADAVQKTTVPGLWLLPAGQWDRAVLRALAGEELQKVFAALRQHYDFVVIDSHPVLQAADSLLIGLHVDAVILSLMRDLSRMPRVSTACQRLADLGVPVLGAVVNAMPEDDVPSGRYSYAAPVKAAT
jgi:capsular exopolysaccharide synthesis family protein